MVLKWAGALPGIDEAADGTVDGIQVGAVEGTDGAHDGIDGTNEVHS